MTYDRDQWGLWHEYKKNVDQYSEYFVIYDKKVKKGGLKKAL